MRASVRAVMTAIVSIAALFFSHAPVFGQTVTGRLTGRVLDQQGGALPGATLTLTNERTTAVRTAQAGSEGDFVFVALEPSVYALAIDLTGFKTLVMRPIVLPAADTVALGALRLSVGDMTDSVTVPSHASRAQTDSSENSSLLTSKQIEAISVKGRDVVSLLRLVPGASYDNDIDSLGSGFGSTLPSLNGNRNTTSTVTVDGLPGNDYGDPQNNSSSVNLDAVSEVKVQTSTYRAETGRNAGAVVQIVTKSGTNDFKGSAYWYKRHERFNANDYFNNQSGLAKPLYRFDTVGANAGGPIAASKAFYFYSTEYAKTQTPQPVRRVTVPTALERQGDFSRTVDANGVRIPIRDSRRTGACSATDATACFPGNIVPESRIDPNGRALLNAFPLPNVTDPAITRGQYNYQFQESLDVRKLNHVARVDLKPSAQHTIYARVSLWNADNEGFAVPAGSANWGQVRQKYIFADRSVAAGWTRIFNSRVVNELTVGVRRNSESGPATSDEELARTQRSAAGFTIGQLNPAGNPLGVLPQTAFGGITSAANFSYNGRFPVDGFDFLVNVSDNVTYTRGRHLLKAGGTFESMRNSEGYEANFAGTFDFSRNTANAYDANYAYANALLGVFRSYTESTRRPEAKGTASGAQWFVQDTWKAARRLTVDAGMRFVWYQHWRQHADDASIFSPERYDLSRAPLLYRPVLVNGQRVGRNPVTGETVPATLIGFVVPGTGDPLNGLVSASDEGYPRGFKNQAPVLLEPRVGFAYDLSGDGKTAVRGGFGIYHDPVISGFMIRLAIRNPPTQSNPQFFDGTFGDLASAAGNLAPVNVTSFQRDGKTPVVYGYSLGVQRDLGFDTLLSATYVGSRSRYLQVAKDLNLVPYGARFLAQNLDATNGNRPLPDNFFRPYPGYGTIDTYENSGNSDYQALQTQLARRFSHGLQFGVAYTLSRTRSDADREFNAVATYRPRELWNYGRAGYDQRHVFIVNYTWDVPRLSRVTGNQAVVRALFDGWQLSGITALVSGRPKGVTMSTVDGADIAGGGDGARVNVIGDPDLSRGERTRDRWFDTAAFARPAQGDWGNAPADAITLPGVHNWDMSLFKNVPLGRGRMMAQVRWEIYNVFNHSQFSDVDAAARFDVNGVQTNARFGQVITARPPRIMQLSLRVSF